MTEPPRKIQRVDDGSATPPPHVEAAEDATIPTNFRVNEYFEHNGATSVCRTLQELHALQSVGAVLDKPQWWRKWQERTDVRDRWLQEIERGYVERTFTTMFKWWPEAHDRMKLLHRVREAIESDYREDLLAKAWATVPYKSKWFTRWEDQDEGAEEAEQGGDENEAEMYTADEDTQYADALNLLDESIDTSSSPLRKLNPYGQLGWYVHQWSRIRRMREVGAPNLTNEEINAIFGYDIKMMQDIETENEYDLEETPENPVYVAANLRDAREATDVICALRGPTKLHVDAMRAALGNADEAREDVLVSLVQYTALIHIELDALRQFVIAYVDQVMHRCRLRPSDLDKGRNPSGITWGPVEETFLSDNLIPSELKQAFINQIRVLEDVPPDKRDWHPHANEQVLDLVHPSLYCGISGVTKHIPPTSAPLEAVKDLAKQLLPLLIRSETDGVVLECPQSGFQWLPSEFEISETSETCNIRSYINNLHPQDHPDLYKSIAAIFACFIPLFEGVLGSLKAPISNVLMPSGDILEREQEGELPLRLAFPSEAIQVNRPSVSPFSIRGQTLQVIVKIAEIILTPGKPQYSGGSWHIEGTNAERIVATGIYYFQSENLTDSHLAFRTNVEAPVYPQNDHAGVGVTYGLANRDVLVQTLGAVTTMESRCLVFPNVLHHQVQPFELVDKTKSGIRKILCFFVIDPSHRIPSTATIAPQQREWIERARQQELQQSTLGTDVPETVQKQILEWAHAPGLMLDQAKAYRLELMDERSPANTFSDEDWVFSLCEH